MRATTLLPLAAVVAVAFSFLAYSPDVHAEGVEIQFTGLNLVYDSPKLFDATSDAGGGALASESDALTSVQFFTDGGVDADISDVFADVLVEGATLIPVGGGTILTGGNGDAFGLDLFSTTGGGTEWKLQLNVDKLQVFYSGLEIAIAGTGVASSVAAQDLPFGLADIDDTKAIKFAFVSSNLTDVTDDGTHLTGFKASGTGTIRASLVPEPSTIVGLLMGAVALAMVGWLRRRS